MGKGRQYELDMVRDINEAARLDRVFCATLDYSGVASDSDADLVLGWYQDHDWYALHLVELKKRTGEDGKRFKTHPLSGSTPEQNGWDELERLATAGPSHAERWFALKPDHRELLVFNAEWLRCYLMDDCDETTYMGWLQPSDRLVDCTEPRLTPGGHVSMKKPTLDVWPSSASGENDAVKLLRELDIPESNLQ